MKHFILIFLSVYLLANSYIFIRGWQLMPQTLGVRLLYCLLFLLFAGSFLLAMLGRHTFPLPLLKWLSMSGNAWVILMVYLIIALLAIDLLRSINHFFPFFPACITENVFRARWMTAGSIFFILLIVLSIGYYRFSHPVVERLELHVDKYARGRKELRIVAVSDVHLGVAIGKERLKEYVDRINALQPEIVIISGDLIDVSVRPLEAYRMYEELKQIQAPLGVYMVTGNHEYISGIKSSLAFIGKTGIHLLDNACVSPDSTFLVAGQRDISSHSWQPFDDILKDAPASVPVIGLTHQPQNVLLESARRSGVDFLFCGHTHEGQFWPGNQIVKSIYKIPYGYAQMGNMQVYVSSGLGIWGPQYRIGTQSEIVSVKLTFRAEK